MSPSKYLQVPVNSWNIGKVKGKQVKLIRGIKHSTLFHVIEEVIKDVETTREQVSPETFDSLVVNAAASDVTSSIRPTERVTQHIACNFYILTTLV